MDNSKGLNENCEFHVDGGKQYETSELKQENQPSHVTLDKKETDEGDEKGRILRRGEDPEVLESVQKYANRIKSFLGWEPNADEQDNESDKSVTEAEDSKNVSEGQRGSLGNDAIKEKDYDSLEEEKNDNSLTEPQGSKPVMEEKLDTYLPTDQPNESQLVDISPKSESGDKQDEKINPEIEDADEKSSSPKDIPDDNIKELISDLLPPEVKSESDFNNSDSTTLEMEQNELSKSDNSTSFETTAEDATDDAPHKNNTSDADLEKPGITDNAEKQQKETSEPETDVSKDILGNGNLNGLSESVISLKGVEQIEKKENGSCENLNEIVDKTNLQESISLGNIKKPYMEEIRRLSIDIVKDVIESARNSVHEMFANKGEPETISEVECANHGDGDTSCAINGSKNSEKGSFGDKDTLAYTTEVPILHNETFKSKDNMNLTKDLQDQNEDITDDDTICGFGNFRPRWIQKYATSKTYLLLFSLVGVINGAYYSYNVSIISTLEKRYAFEAKISGTLLLADEITPLVLGVLVGYFGGKTHRPRMLALGMFMSAACCFISALPYVIYGSGKHLVLQDIGNVTGPELCNVDIREESCDSDDRPPTMTVVGIFLLASILKGFATLSYYVIGLSYMDDNTKKKNTPIYLSVALALRLLGPLVGFLMSSAFLKIYENPFEDPGFGPEDPRWIGAWWMGFLLQGVLLVIFTLPITLFPRRLPSHKKPEKIPAESNKESARDTLKGLVSALKRLGKNPIFIVLIINTTMKIFGHFGHAIMLPKYMENQFRLSAADASLFSGATSIFCMMISCVLGGFLIWKFRPNIKFLLGGLVISEIILCTGFLILMIPRCQPAEMLHFGMSDEGLILDSVCNQNCDCSTKSFTPFCGPDGKTTYFSPCYAGCTQELINGDSSKKQMVFGNCSCVSVPDSFESDSVTITEGFCPDETCWSKAVAYLVILFILVTISNTLTVTHTMILLRSVHPSDKSVALGTCETFICLFGFIPFPVTFGALVDSACLVWEKSCGETGNCWFYDMEKYGYLLHGTAAFFCALSTLCLITMYFLSSRVRNLYKEDDEEEYIDNIKLDTVSGSVTKL